MVLTAKPEDIPLWIQYAKDTRRAHSLLIFDERHSINFIDYLLARHGIQGISNIVEILMRVIAASDAATGNSAASTEAFWEHAVRQLLNYALPLLYSAYGTVSVASLIAFIVSAATDAKQYMDDGWAATNFAARTLRLAVASAAHRLPEEELQTLLAYWFLQYPGVPDRTRGNVVASVTAKLDRFLHGRLKRMFCSGTTIVPEMVFQGGIIVMGTPVLTWGDDGIIAQQIVKSLFQGAVEGRNALAKEQRERPVCLWMDEAHYYLSVADDGFLSTCRASRCGVVALSQSLPSYYARIGRDKTDAVDGILGKFNTHVFALNSCPRTNSWASQLIGRSIQHRGNQSRSVGTNSSRGMNSGANRGSGDSSGGGHGTGGFNHNWGNNRSHGESWGDSVGIGSSENSSFGTAEQMDFIIEPRFFATELKSGGSAHGNKVTSLWFRAGARFKAAGGGNTLLVTFKQ